MVPANAPLRPDFRDALETQWTGEAVLRSQPNQGRWKKVGKIRSLKQNKRGAFILTLAYSSFERSQDIYPGSFFEPKKCVFQLARKQLVLTQHTKYEALLYFTFFLAH